MTSSPIYMTSLAGGIQGTHLSSMGGPASKVPCPPSKFLVCCPKCASTKDCCNTPLLVGLKWCSIKCSQCNQSTTAARWNCEREETLYFCEKHASEGHAIKKKIPIVKPLPLVLCDAPPIENGRGGDKKRFCTEQAPIRAQPHNGTSKRVAIGVRAGSGVQFSSINLSTNIDEHSSDFSEARV